MKKALLVLLMIAVLTVAGCGGDAKPAANTAAPSEPAQEAKQEPLDLSGTWIMQALDGSENYAYATIQDSAIEVDFVINGEGWLYWAGSYEPPTDAKDSYTWISNRDANRNGLLASEDPTKEFSYKDGHLTCEGSIQGDAMNFDMQRGELPARTDATGAAVSFENGVLVADDYTITITDYKIIPAGQPGNDYGDKPVIAFWYDTTNTSGKDVNPTGAWVESFSAIQDNNANFVNQLEMAGHPDHALLHTQMASIKEGGTLANAIAYELSDTVTPVTVKATNGMFGMDLGTQDFPVVQ